ncbi:MAG: hypothetical protein JSU66_15885 [Deltaproteobacteria bacterium]|nr:MAG: hypothetical protein JSU66_15885 [Deltaproteobacteria bacterium]
MRVLAALAAAATPAFAQVDLAGTWYVLVHYTDDQAHDTEAVHWDDRIWVFAREDGKLRWTEYTLVVFDDRSGRFEQTRAGMVRVLHAWEPNALQAKQIRAGLEVNPRGSKSKLLEGSDVMGWRSRGRAAAASATVITYQETWTIDDLDALPVFTRDDVLGSGIAEDFGGRTQYTTREIDAASGELRGAFERDGTRHGSFRMMRAGATGLVKERGKSHAERWLEQARQAAIEGAQSPELRAEVRERVVEGFRTRGLDPDAHAEQVDAITTRILAATVEDLRAGGDLAGLEARIRERVALEIASGP